MIVRSPIKLLCAFLATILLCGSLGLHAQQRPQYSQYIFNNYLLNPALSGIENYTDVKLGYRGQWTGLEGAPVTSFFSINAPIGNTFVNGDANSFASEESQNPFSRFDPSAYQASDPHHGIGMMIVSDKTGAITQTDIQGTYAYHLGISRGLNLSLGISAGYTHQQINISMLTVKDGNDQTLSNLSANTWAPNLGFGIWVYARSYFAGFSVQQLLPRQNFEQYNNHNLNNPAVQHYFFTAGIKVFLNEDISITPSALLKFTKPVPVSFDVNTKVSFRNKFWLGASYRRNDSYTGMAGFNLSSFLNFGYGYDMNSAPLRTVPGGTHEVFIGLLLNNRFKLNCPTHGF
ncbi:PorP/SprF family type IX secretion system membrane protein [Mucilaginibacter aquariorum]|uniref:Type IX secretion system membrane protein PorP/SprF n=1 Tax=Mucilaginibacter aquariorum TaxID=2967225 RepID=A0ABT1SZR0_9SPHI|nr:type IX secretion system membrane protein PorP/SprF [Mucilaginibacter aquariorum]MCQ6957546.1 type IX secretion system membrane protein PorP/SprF [Mucilaginibacter aquariorum]